MVARVFSQKIKSNFFIIRSTLIHIDVPSIYFSNYLFNWFALCSAISPSRFCGESSPILARLYSLLCLKDMSFMVICMYSIIGRCSCQNYQSSVYCQAQVQFCKIIVSAPVPVPFLWTFDLGFGTWIWDLNLGLGFGTGLLGSTIFLKI